MVGGINLAVFLVRVYPEDGGEFQMQERAINGTSFLCPANPERGEPASASPRLTSASIGRSQWVT
jgi:hypothetical protein